jgi:hypothetical protein
MGNDLFSYFDRLELMAFFAGYPLIYTIILFLAGDESTRTVIKKKLVAILPVGYALVATLYAGLQLKNLWPDNSWSAIPLLIQNSFLKIWGLLAILFWLPLFRKKPVFSLLHSLVFFFFLLKDLLQYGSSPDNGVIKNDMKIYTDSLLLNLSAFIVVALVYFGFERFRKKRTPKS